jgi:transcriptional antiterminator/mannitol/fructose-specific phosphotransferase system IIA component (Ntr-type)
MVPLTSRQCAVLRALLIADGPLTAAQVASRLGVTPRVVRYDLRAVQVWLAQRGIRLFTKPNYGVLVGASCETKKRLQGEMEALTGRRLVLSSAERAHVLILSLLTSDRPLLGKELAHRLDVSHPTVLAAMRGAEPWLAEHGLRLVRRTHVGFVLAGKETTWRQALVEFLTEMSDDKLLLALCAGSRPVLQITTEDQVGLASTLAAFLADLELTFSRLLVDAMESHLQRQFADPSRIALVLTLAVLIYRVQQGRFVELDPAHLASLRQREEFQAAARAAEQIEQRCDVSLPEEETACIATQVLGAWTRRDLCDVAVEEEMGGIDTGTLQVVRQLLAEVSIYLQPCLEVDPLLTRNLAAHVRTTLNRLRFGLPIRNPLLEDIRREYPYVLQVVERAHRVLEQAAGVEVPEEEMAYIAMHLAAAMERLRSRPETRQRVLIVCGEGTATAWLLVSRIQVELPQIEIVEVTSVVKVSEEYLRAHDVSAIISTVPIKASPVPVIVVNPLLQDEDKANIKALLEPDPARLGLPLRPPQSQGCPLADLLGPRTMTLQATARDWQQVVALAGALLLTCGAIEPRYIEAMVGLIEQHGPYVVIMPGVALLHAHPADGAKKTCLSLVTLRESVAFGHPRHDPVRVAVALASVDNHAHRRALRQLIELLDDPEASRRLRTVSSTEEACALVARVSAAN